MWFCASIVNNVGSTKSGTSVPVLSVVTPAPTVGQVVPGVAVQTWSVPWVVPVPHAAKLATTVPLASSVVVTMVVVDVVDAVHEVPEIFVPLAGSPHVIDPCSVHTPLLTLPPGHDASVGYNALSLLTATSGVPDNLPIIGAHVVMLLAVVHVTPGACRTFVGLVASHTVTAPIAKMTITNTMMTITSGFIGLVCLVWFDSRPDCVDCPNWLVGSDWLIWLVALFGLVDWNDMTDF